MRYKLICGDCLDVMPTLTKFKIDLILVDPPYGTTKCKWDSVIPFNPMWKNIKRIRNNNTPIVIFGSEPFSSFLRVSNIKEFKYDWIWNKENGSNFLNVKYMPMKEHEIVSVFYKKCGQYYPIEELRSEKSLKRRGFKDRVRSSKKCIEQCNEYNLTAFTVKDKKFRCPKSIQVFHLDTLGTGGKGKRFHPTQKPIALLEYLIKTYTKPGETVLDFTMGSGSTGVACFNTERNFIGIEKDKEIFNIAKKRILDVKNSLT
jgi:DNA modification methylase